ncbi:MAG: PilN domain-containing protein [Candidatus Saccharimonadia bacterium]
MINLIPPTVKTEIKFARMNSVVIHYLKIIILLIVVLGVGFGGTYTYLMRKTASVNDQLSQKQSTIDTYNSTTTAAKSLNARIAAIKTIENSQPKFSTLLADIAKFTLQGTAITSITLTGDDTKPVQISAVANSYNDAVSLRDALASSPRISGADIISVSSQNNTYTVSILIGFKPGEAR